MKVDQHIIDRSSWDEINVDGWFRALIPPTWEVDDEEEVIIFDPDGVGELNISFLERGNGRGKRDIANEIISSWAEELGHEFDYEINIIKRNKDLLIVSADFIAVEADGEIEFWRIFAVIGSKIALDINYNCEVKNRDREEKIIEGIVDSIRLTEEDNIVGLLEQDNEY
jgi:hypothetical protein